MNRLAMVAGAMLLCGLAAVSQGQNNPADGPAPATQRAAFEQRWVYGNLNISNEAGVQAFLDLLKRCKSDGVTHITFSDRNSYHPEEAPAEYPQWTQRILAAAKEDNIVLCPLVFPIGYSGAYFRDDANLAAGIPARNEPFIVKDGVAEPDPAATPRLVNADLSRANDGWPTGWQVDENQKPAVSLDTTVHQNDLKASLKFSDFDKLARGTRGAQVYQIISEAKPFQYYRLSMWIKSEDCRGSSEDIVRITSSNGMRRNTFKNITVPPTSDWKRYEITFNTFEVPDGKLRFAVGAGGARSGSMWISDIKIEPAGLLLVLRRPIKPLVVTSEDGATTFVEGKDFQPIADPVVSRKPFSGEFTIDHKAPQIVLTKDSAIKDGQRLSVSFYHFMRIYDDQDVISLQDPGTVELMDAQMKATASAWPTDNYFMKHDEIRVSGWEVQPQGEHLTPAQLLARNAKAGYDLIKKYRPNATIYVFSDMYNPFHNARPFDTPTHEGAGYYYLCAGNYDGSWDGLPKDVVIANWYAKDNRSTKFFGDRGYKQILCGFYDGTSTAAMQNNITNWMKVSEGVPNVIGIMYTTWHSNYKQLDEYFRLVSQYPNFTSAAPAQPLQGK